MKKKRMNSEVKIMGQNTIRTLLNRNVERQLVREYLLKETEKAGFGGLTFNRTPSAC